MRKLSGLLAGRTLLPFVLLTASISRSSPLTGIHTSRQLRRMAGAISQSWALM